VAASSRRRRAEAAGTGSGQPSLPPIARGQRGILVALVLVTLAAWAITLYQARTMPMPMGVVVPEGAAGAMAGMDGMAGAGMGGMAAGGWSPGAFAAFVVAWGVMMAAMMLPAVTPMLLLYRTMANRRKHSGAGLAATWILAAGYLLVWTAIGAAVYAVVQIASGFAGRLDVPERQTWAPLALGGVLILAGLYQFTPLKRACLRHCQSPIGFVMGHWREGRLGALRMGLVHGAYCLGCCWALFTVLVAAGVMSLAWMLLLTLVVFAEKILPRGQQVAGVVGVAFIVLGVLVGISALPMPGIA
jgi:predicted metal-binding membrane protein